jgi:hypothetical protein
VREPIPHECVDAVVCLDVGSDGAGDLLAGEERGLGVQEGAQYMSLRPGMRVVVPPGTGLVWQPWPERNYRSGPIDRLRLVPFAAR